MEYDLIIKNGYIVDGTGNPWFRADIGINDGKIVKIGNVCSASGYEKIEVKDLIVSPGFIDIHTHSARAKNETVLAQNNKITREVPRNFSFYGSIALSVIR